MDGVILVTLTMKDTITEIIQSWDTAFSTRTSADYSVCLTAGRGQRGYYFLDIFRARMEYPDLLTSAKALYQQYQPTIVLIENKASGQSLIQDLRRIPIPVLPINPDADKYRRASGVTGMVQAGQVHLPAYADWVEDFIEELANFPDGSNDDQVDVVSMVLGYFKPRGLGGGGRSAIVGEKKKSLWRD